MKNSYQCYGIATDGTLVHAGIRSASRVTEKTAIRWEREWRAWRKRYLRSVPGDYQLRQSQETAWLEVRDSVDPMGFHRVFPV